MFLPEDYEAPKSSSLGYMKLQDGENRIRILSAPIIGWEDWTIEKKPVRFRYNQKPDKSLDPTKPIRHFWAMIVWNYTEEKIQILQITQATIRKNIEKLYKDSDWGAPYFYDIKITKEGEGKDTEYHVNPVSQKPISPNVIMEFKNKPINLNALFDSEDPFDRNLKTHTVGIFTKDEASALEPEKLGVTEKQAEELSSLLEQCDPAYKHTVWEALDKSKITKLIDLSAEMYERLKKAAIKKVEEYQNQDLPF